MDTLVDSARSAVQLAHRAKESGNLVNAGRLFTTAGLNFLSVAVTEYADVEAGLKFLEAENFSVLLSDAATASEELIAAVRSGQAAASAVTGRYVFLALSHAASLVGVPSAAAKLCGVAAAREVRGTPFWDAYSDCYAKFFGGTVFDVPVLPLRPPEKYWLPYIEWMALSVRGVSTEAKREELENLFVKRNVDKRFANADAHQIEGSVSSPANWDFRLQALSRSGK